MFKNKDPKGFNYFKDPEIQEDLAMTEPSKEGLLSSRRLNKTGSAAETKALNGMVLAIFGCWTFGMSAWDGWKLGGSDEILVLGALGVVMGAIVSLFCGVVIGIPLVIYGNHQINLKKLKLWTEEDFNSYFADWGKLPSAVTEWRTLGAKKFCQKYFAKSGPGLINFLEEKVKIDPKILNFAVSIPKVKELSVDSFRKILLAYTGEVRFEHVLDLGLQFSGYSLEEIERIFTNPGSRKVLVELPLKALPVAKSFDQLLAREIPLKLEQLERLEGKFTFKVLRTKAEYEATSDEFSNCVREYWTEAGFVVGLKVPEKAEPA